MSSRVLKKLQGDNDLELQPDDGIEDQGSDDTDEIDLATYDKRRQLNRNPFDLLNQQSPSESEVKEDDNETEHASTAANLPSGPISKKKKKKRKKKSAKHHGNHISSEDNDLTDKYLSDIDSLIGKVCEPGNTATATRVDLDKTLLSVELKNLHPLNEMRRTFGKRVVKLENKRGRQKLTLKSTYLVTAKESWPPLTKNIITMKPCAPPENTEASSGNDKTQWFAFEHSQFYQGVQNMFLTALDTTDSDQLVNLFTRCPYHVDTLIQLSEMCKITDDTAMASDLIQRAVLVLETSLHPSFSLVSGNSRLDYKRQENRGFFIVLFKQAQYVEARSCCRTAFELSKLILSLNPDVDPLAMVLIIDYYALRSKQYAWLVKFYEDWDAKRNLSQLPNMAYSYALALFYLLGDCEKADKALQYALLMFPGVLRPLLDELSVQTDSRVIAASYFNSGVSGSQSPALHQLVSLYVCRAKVVWRDTSVLLWLERNVNTVLDRVDKEDEIVNDYNSKRSQRYVSPPRPILRHVILSDYGKKVPLAQFVAGEKEINLYDPLPPLESINFYERKSSSSSPTTENNRSISMFFQSLLPTFNLRAQQNAAGAAGAVAAGGIVGGGIGLPVAAAALPAPAAAVDDEVAQVDRHLEELNMNLENAAAENDAAEAEVNASYRELTRSLTSVVDAMRDYLSSFHITETQSQNADVEENGSSEEDTSDYFD
ncbi:transcription factor 25 isoform X1 [Eupeodes corollae]|uniref:transcription factor 25 isoform X1 n=1 Tax=Eupeodes corollae TaxID=290404 RepID=UPI0024908B72|nr:transcription factor 25 isoform X1 [Eupeodes corollae]XP_055912440.1 transcription factor 25 isoform X1 [Eupeodes corollae]